MHCELTVPALLPKGEEAAAALEGLRLPALELLLARSRRRTDDAQSLEQWLAESFGGDSEDEIPAGALTLAASGASAGEAIWLRADPVHLKLNRDQLLLMPATGFGLAPAEAASLAETLNKHFTGELHFDPLHPERWCVRADTVPAQELRTETPLEVAGLDINRHLPAGPDSKRWHGLLNEIQMLLHEHPVNEAREARGVPAVNSLWLWGAGRLPAEAAAPWQSLSADEPLAQGYAQVAGLRHRPLPKTAGEWLDRLQEEGRHLAVLDALRLPCALGDFEAWRERLAELEERWFGPLVAGLKAGQIGMTTLLVPDAADLRTFESSRNDLRHFWRRPKSVANYL